MGLERYLLWFWESEGKGARFNLHLFARSIRSRLFNVHIREAPGGERRCSNRFLSNSLSPPCPLKPMDALWKLFADVWWWSVSVMVYIHNAMEQGLPFSHLLELKKDSTAAGRECCGRTCSSCRSRSSPATWGERGSVRSNSIIIHVGKTMGLWKNSPSALHINQFFDLRGVNFFPQN